MRITRVGLDLAKRVFQVHGVDEHGRARVDKKLSRGQVRPFFAQLSPCVIGMEPVAERITGHASSGSLGIR